MRQLGAILGLVFRFSVKLPVRIDRELINMTGYAVVESSECQSFIRCLTLFNDLLPSLTKLGTFDELCFLLNQEINE